MKVSSKSGLTLIEMLTVITIIGILVKQLQLKHKSYIAGNLWLQCHLLTLWKMNPAQCLLVKF